MEMYEYLRKEAIAMTERSNPDLPCRRGNGACCTTMAPVIPEDAALMLTAIQNGDISQPVVETAIANAADPTRTSCPFLGDDNACTIYDNRPLACAMWAVAGPPRPGSKEMAQAAEKFIETDEDSQVSFESMAGPYSCDSCFDELVAKRPKVSVKDIQISLGVAHYIGEYNGTPELSGTLFFVKKELTPKQ